MTNEGRTIKQKIKKFSIILLVAILFAVIVLAFTINNGKSSDLEEVQLRANFFISGEHAPYYLGIDKGFYEDEGIELKLNSGEGSSLAVQLVGRGDEEFGLASSEIVLKGRTNGIPVISVSVINPVSPVTIISLKDVEIRELEDLYGKTLGVNYKSNTYQQYKALVRKKQLDSSQITEVPGAANIESLLSGRVDAILRQTQNEAVSLKIKGYEVNEQLFEDYGIHFYGITLITNDDLIKENPELVRRFVRATIKSWEYSIDNPEEAIESLVAHNKNLDKQISLQQFLKFVSLFDKQSIESEGFGYMTAEEWHNTQEMLYELGIIENKINVNTVFTNEFL